jgi:hypothetical protein
MKKVKPRKTTRTKINALAEQSPKVINSVDTMSIKNVHTLTKELLVTLSTIEKSLELATKVMAILNKHNVNLSQLNKLDLSKIFTRIEPAQLEKTLKALQNPEIVKLFKTLNTANQKNS